MKKTLIIILTALLALSLGACTSKPDNSSAKTTYTIGICNYVDDASLNQIVENIENQLKVIAKENDVEIIIKSDNGNADANIIMQIVSNYLADDVDLMVAVATPVALIMQGQTEENSVPVIFAAVSDPVGCELVNSLNAPGANISGTSDFLDTTTMMDLIFVLDPELSKVGLLYDASQDSSTTAINMAKAYLANKGVEVVEKTGTNVTEIALAADALIDEGVKVVFTPSDNTVMAAQLSIYEKFAQAGVKHYAGADSFALNGAFLGYGVDYANLGRETANMVKQVLIDKVDIANLPVVTFDNGTATINIEICEMLNLNYEEVAAKLAPYCMKVQPIETAESFD